MAQVHGKAGAAPYRKGDRLMFRALTSMLILGVLTYFCSVAVFRQSALLVPERSVSSWLSVSGVFVTCSAWKLQLTSIMVERAASMLSVSFFLDCHRSSTCSTASVSMRATSTTS